MAVNTAQIRALLLPGLYKATGLYGAYPETPVWRAATPAIITLAESRNPWPRGGLIMPKLLRMGRSQQAEARTAYPYLGIRDACMAHVRSRGVAVFTAMSDNASDTVIVEYEGELLPSNEEIAAKARENMQRAKEAIERQKMQLAYQQMANTQAQNNMLQNAYAQGAGSLQGMGLASAGIWGSNQYINNATVAGTGTITMGGATQYIDSQYAWMQVPPGGSIPVGAPVMRSADGMLMVPAALGSCYYQATPSPPEPEPVREVSAAERALDLEVTPMEISVATPTRDIDL